MYIGPKLWMLRESLFHSHLHLQVLVLALTLKYLFLLHFLGMFQVAHQVWGLRDAETRGKEKSHRSKDVLSLGRSFGGCLKRRNRNNFVCKGIIWKIYKNLKKYCLYNPFQGTRSARKDSDCAFLIVFFPSSVFFFLFCWLQSQMIFISLLRNTQFVYTICILKFSFFLKTLELRIPFLIFFSWLRKSFEFLEM